MKDKIEKVAVLGAGVMGAQIAGHLANAGIPSLLFDINQDLAKKGVESLTSLKPAPLYKPKNASMVEPCNYDEHLEKLTEVDWVIEAVAERLDIKHTVYQNIIPHLKSTVIISSNTSGIPLNDLISVFSDDLKKRFMITHFFNPPRYMRLLELVKGENTSQEVYDTIASFGENMLGKGIVHAKDTPNFIGNRIGVFGMMVTLEIAEKMGLTVEEVDKLTGTITGRPKSATFRTADVVGLDTLAHVAQTSYDRGENDEERNVFKIPSILKTLIDEGRLGQKSKAGFYKKTKEGILSLDFATGDYTPQKVVRFDGFRLAKDRQYAGDKIKAMAFSDDKAGKFFWEVLARTLLYSANRIPEISDDIINIDQALKWGFGWELGPFETWDAIGVSESLARMKAEGRSIPAWIQTMLNSGRETFYTIENGMRTYYDPNNNIVQQQDNGTKSLNLLLQKSAGNLIKKHWSASLIDLGDGILNVEYHSILQPTLNPIDGSMVEIIQTGLELLDAGKYKGMVLGHQGANFCAGANLAGILQFCEDKDWDGLEKTVKTFQDLTQAIRFSKAPVVAAPFQLTLGGGFEFIGPAAHRVASAELYIGAVEVGVGLIPGAGGNLRLLLNLFENAGKGGIRNAFQIAQKAFETIGFAKVATSADEAKYLAYLLKSDTVVMNDDQRIWVAKQKTMTLAENYEPPQYRDDLKLPGAGGRTAMTMALKGFKSSGKISDHDEFIGKKLAYVITGGDKAGLTKSVEEQYLLDIERETFISLAGEKLSQDRIRFMLKKGKPLRN
ncbi:MAG: 3-hydroxyacyl-CoA dehydrogenase [Candidatus Marinimicrobia bacterium]|jgi:3-hydroxyacyl-CoA dehydrogenase|nr:3-hydroxyacyl-CoA dehydrogenase [Candidatus Neomarinimicrobiota bacterium]MBT3496114.1 3-hydroxyacyl-CoA dehydrogenase [Candidatus Neomarinimicrobiota bacterium]MBT3692040.1 3-hydroxyacyl-CoA dehydrogenase [Candidatus Neomarinimicrobiota bacterium]MBT3732302.1 3-hydroxyacyl-CoA dehydrogenase [Candidatus Neomarinimicrobiota bacterium]MBT4144104.1 3-hydroxyacyl-CoA dehydrogenase [Candidatus Neomarinimicrobiota bacterium]